MRYRTFGRTGLEVSELVFGGGWVGGVLIHQDDDTKLKVLRHAIDSGINWIDTATSYGNGQSEQALGWLLPELDTKPYVSTKVVLDTARLDDIAGQIERSAHDSLERMKLDSVELLQLHNPIMPDNTGKAISAEEVKVLSNLPSKEVLLSQMLSVFQGPTTQFAGVFSSLLRKLVGTLEAIKEKKAQG